MSTQYGRDQREYIRFRDAELNRFGEMKIKHDHCQDDQFKKDYDPTYEDELGMKHPYEHEGEKNIWQKLLVKIYQLLKPKKNC